MKNVVCPLFVLFLSVCSLEVSAAAVKESKPEVRINALVQAIVPDNGPVRAPYELARYDMTLMPTQGVERTVESLRLLALERQNLLEARWLQLKKDSGGWKVDPDLKASLALLEYAFGGSSPEAALAAARTSGGIAKLRLARLLLAECIFDEAVRLLVAIADERDNPYAGQALQLLVQHSVERKVLAASFDLIPLPFDLDAYLAKRSLDPAIASWIESVGSSCIPPAPDCEVPDSSVYEEFVAVSDENDELRASQPFSSGSGDVPTNTLDRAWLETWNRDLLLYREEQTYVSSNRATFCLKSRHAGPVEFRLYRFADRTGWDAAGPVTLGAMTPVRVWTNTFRPLRDNNTKPEPWVDQVQVDVPEEGFYLLSAGVRYAPRIAGQKFCVSHVGLYMQTSRNLVVLAAIDRRSGAPVRDVKVRLNLSGEPVLNAVMPAELSEAERVMFCRGFQGLVPAGLSARDALTPGSVSSRAIALKKGRDSRLLHPSICSEFEATTDENGVVSFPVNAGDREYSYRFSAWTPGRPCPSALTPPYAEPEHSIGETSVIAWANQPTYRPGSMAHIKGIFRHRSGLALSLPQTNGNLEVIGPGQYILWKSNVVFSPSGTFSADIPVLGTASTGGYKVRVAGVDATPYEVFSVNYFRIPSFTVTVNADCRSLCPGEVLRGGIRAEYPGGRPLKQYMAEVVLETGDSTPATCSVVPDDGGFARFEFAAPMLGPGKDCEVRATVTDESGERQTVSCPVRIQRQPFKLSVSADPAVTGKGTTLAVVVAAADWSDNRLPGVPVICGGLGQAHITDSNGIAAFTLPLLKDRHGLNLEITALYGTNIAKASSYVYLTDGSSGFSRENSGRASGLLRVNCPDRVNAGTTLVARIEINDPERKEGPVLVFAKNTRLLASRVLRLGAGSHAVSFPADSDYSPNVVVEAVMFRRDGVICATSRSVYVPPVSRFLTIELASDKTDYRPHEKCAVSVKATDWKNNPVAGAEISLGVVDAVLYGLAADPTPDLRDFFWRKEVPVWPRSDYDGRQPDADTVVWWFGPKYAWGSKGRAMSMPVIMSSRGRFAAGRSYGGAGCSMRMTGVRKDFRTDAFWVANLVTDHEGKARAGFVFPDNISNWRFTARGVTADTKVGEVRVERQTMLPLQVELCLPRAVRMGDTFTPVAVVHNVSSAGGKIVLDCDAGGTRDGVSADLMAGNTLRTNMPQVTVTKDVMRFAASVRDAAGADADSIEKTITAGPRGYRTVRTYAGLVKSGGTIPLGNGMETQGVFKVTVALECDLAGAVESALDSLIEYPYGCVEQTMSRFMPAVVASKAMRRAGLTCQKEKDLPLLLAAGVERLAGYQHADGGWGWWENDATSDFMTAYVLEGLVLCSQAGHEVPAGMMEKAANHLYGRLRGNLLSGANVQAVGAVDIRLYATHSLAAYYGLKPALHDPERLQLNLLVTGFSPDGDADNFSLRDEVIRADLLRLLGSTNAVSVIRQLVSVREPFATGSRESLLAAASILEAGVQVDPGNERWMELARSLMAARTGGGWCDTVVSAGAVRGLSALLAAGSGSKYGDAEIYAGKKRVAVLKGEKGRRSAVDLDRLAGAGELRIVCREKDSGGFWSAKVESLSNVRPVVPTNPVAVVSCRYFISRGQPLEIVPDAAGRLNVKAGEMLEILVECNLIRPLSYVRITIPRPCGVELSRKLRPGPDGIAQIEERDDSFNFFASEWAAGKHELRLLVGAETPGELFAPLPELAPMYGDPLPVAVKAASVWNVSR